MTLFSANELRLAYGHQTLLDGVTVAISAGEKVGLVGRNGCGKTSLLKILANENQADSGETSARRGLRIGYLPQEFELDPVLSVYDNIAAGAADVASAVTRYENGDMYPPTPDQYQQQTSPDSTSNPYQNAGMYHEYSSAPQAQQQPQYEGSNWNYGNEGMHNTQQYTAKYTVVAVVGRPGRQTRSLD